VSLSCSPSRSYNGLPDTVATVGLNQMSDAEEKVVTVDARVPWVSSGVFLKEGNEVQLHAQGTWASHPVNPRYGPEGGGGSAEDPRFPGMALIGRVGEGKPFLVGSAAQIKVTQSGVLFLACNDAHTVLDDNLGAMTVTIRVAGAKSKRGSATESAMLSCDLRMVRVTDGGVIANASGQASIDKLEGLGQALAAKLKEGAFVKGEAVAVVSLRDRSATNHGRILADELADKVTGALVETGWFNVKERINLRAILDERLLESAEIIKNTHVQEKLAGVKYIVIGGVTVTEAERAR